MYKVFIFLFIFSAVFQTQAQDIDLFKKDKNDNYKLPSINDKMTADEFELLSHNMRMKDMLYASIVPGYVHFKTKENKQGYWLLGIRSASYLAMGGLYLSGKHNLLQIDTENLSDEELDDVKRYQNSFYTALGVALTTYVYDVIHGDWVLHKKQEKIRYKYAIKANNLLTSERDNLYPSFAVTIEF